MLNSESTSTTSAYSVDNLGHTYLFGPTELAFVKMDPKTWCIANGLFYSTK
jgi:hypothetical protein